MVSMYFGDVADVAAKAIPGMDVRRDPEWILNPMPGDPLGIEWCSHHTILTDQLDRAEEFLVDVLHGKVIDRRKNDRLGTDSVYIGLADAVFEYANPIELDTVARKTWQKNGRNDTYYAMTFNVADLEKVQRHLDNTNTKISSRDDTSITLDPSDALGVPWCFTTEKI